MISTTKSVLNLRHYPDMYGQKEPQEAASARISVPKIIGHYSLDANRFYRDDASGMSFMVLPPQGRPLNLHVRPDKNFEPPHEHYYKEKLNNMFQFIQRHLNMIATCSDEGLEVIADFVCQREVLQTLMCTPYNLKTNWKMLATNYRNTIYMWLAPTESDLSPEDMWRQQNFKLMEAKLKQYLYLDNPDKSWGKPHPKNAEFNQVFHCVVGGAHSVVYSSTMGGCVITDQDYQGYSPTYERPTNSFMDIKLVLPNSARDPRIRTLLYDDYQALEWWSECKLKDALEICVACAEPSTGYVKRLKFLNEKTLRLDDSNFWTAEICESFVSDMLTAIKSTMKPFDNPLTIFELKYSYENRTLNLKQCRGETQIVFPQWYRLHMETKV